VDGRRAYSWPNHREGPTMSTQVNASRYETESVIPFAANTKTVPANELDKAGQTILQLLHRAAGVVENNNRQALETAQKLSHQLRSAEDRIAELEAEVESYRERAERAEQWLHTVYTEIENRFLRNTNSTPTRATSR
jgi:molecular chaperone GrpE (heat shock protein)